MKRYMAGLLCGFVLVAFGTVNAAENIGKARIDVTGGSEIDLAPEGSSEGGSCGNASWMSEEKNKKYIVAQFSGSKGEWKKGEFSFTPLVDGKITVMLKGEWKRDADKNMIKIWYLYDNINVQGASVIKNGDFEAKKEDGNPKDWYIPKSKDESAIYITDDLIAKEGAGCIKVWHNCGVAQTIQVTGGTKVTISFWYKPAE